ncbi:MAG: hypothetical protein AAGD32_11945 [Planctomycetota bacterium]
MAQFLDTILNSTPAPVVGRSMRFAGLRQALLTENVANATTPGYKQRDMDVNAFRASLAKSLDERDRGGRLDLSGVDESLTFETGGITFHDGNNRSMEQLMTESAKNALQHNALAELLRKQYSQLRSALREVPQ